jgi:hypothetical protein
VFWQIAEDQNISYLVNCLWKWTFNTCAFFWCCCTDMNTIKNVLLCLLGASSSLLLSFLKQISLEAQGLSNSFHSRVNICAPDCSEIVDHPLVFDPLSYLHQCGSNMHNTYIWNALCGRNLSTFCHYLMDKASLFSLCYLEEGNILFCQNICKFLQVHVTSRLRR